MICQSDYIASSFDKSMNEFKLLKFK